MILVTGATGHLGNVVVNDLVANNKSVRAFVLPGDNIDHLENLPIEISYGNVTDLNSIKESMTDVTTIIHTAAIVSIGNTFKAKDIYAVNVGGLENILIAALSYNIKKIIYISSIHAFNELKDSLIITEDTSTDVKKHRIPYAKSKAMALDIVSKYRNKGLDIDVLFPTGIIGPYDYRKGNNALYPIRQFLDSKGKMIYYFNAGYDFVDVRDVAKVVVKALDRTSQNSDFIISGEYISLKDIYSTIAGFVGKTVKLVKVPVMFVKIGVYVAYFFNKIFKIKMPITPQALKILTSKHRISSDKLKTSMGFVARGIKESLEDSVRFIIKEQ